MGNVAQLVFDIYNDNKTYKDWRLYDVMPSGWVVDKTAGSPLFGYVFITNGKSVLNGGQRALLSIKTLPKEPINDYTAIPSITLHKAQKTEKQEVNEDYRKSLNDLARARFQQNLLNDILIDLQICEIEGWSKSDYLNSLKELLSSIGNANASPLDS